MALLVQVSVLISSGRASAGEEAAPARFQPESHFPEKPLLYLSIGNVRQLGELLGKTLPGRIVTHPGFKKAFERPLRLLEDRGERVAAVTGKSPREILGLIRGEVTFSFSGMSPQGAPIIVLAIELGEAREDLLGVLLRVRQGVEESRGRPFETRSIEGIEVTAWPAPPGSLYQGVLGTHLVATTSPELFASMASSYKGAAKEGAGGLARFLDSGVAKSLEEVSGRQVLFAADLRRILGLVLPAMKGSGNDEEIDAILRATGIDRLTSLAYALGSRDGGVEGILRVGTGPGEGGILEVLREGLPAVGDVGEALTRIPSSAHEVQVSRMDGGKLLGGMDRLLRKCSPALAGVLDDLYAQLEDRTGISFEKDLLALGDITFHSFRVMPPAGGLFADQVVLVRTDALSPYRRVLEKLGAFAGAKPAPIEARGGTVQHWKSPWLVNSQLTDWMRGSWTPSLPELIVLAISSAGGFAWADLPEGWTVFSPLPQAVVRHVDISSTGPKLSGEIAEIARARARGASAVLVSRGGQDLLWAYNTGLAVLGAFPPFLAQAGIDAAHLPPAEAFQEDIRPAFLRVSLDGGGVTVHGHRAIESSAGALIVGVGVGSFAAGLLVPTLLKGREAAYEVQCANNMKQLYAYMMAYADQEGGMTLPYSPEGTAAAFQLLREYDKDLPTTLLLCPSDGARHGVAAPPGGKLSEDSLSYELVPWKLKFDRNAILLYDKHPRHRGKRNVLFTDSSIQTLDEAEFRERLETERNRYGGKASPPKAAKKKKRQEKQQE